MHQADFRMVSKAGDCRSAKSTRFVTNTAEASE